MRHNLIENHLLISIINLFNKNLFLNNYFYFYKNLLMRNGNCAQSIF